jgi:exodeoxyribonuclease III
VRLTTWNCYRGRIAQRLERLAPLRPDLVALQECSDPADTAIAWRGPWKHQGVAVVATDPRWKVEPVSPPELPPTALLTVISGPTDFLLLNMWTLPKPTYAACALATLTACASVWDRKLPLVVVGDFNTSGSPGKHQKGHMELVRVLRDKFGIVSAYHAHFDVEFGAERHPTHYWRRSCDAPWHIDYCFVPESWASTIRSVEVGSFEAWTDSDHRPLTVDLAL